MVTTVSGSKLGSKLFEDEDAIISAIKRVQRNSHNHHGHEGHENGHHAGDEVDLLEFFRQVGVRLTEGKDREGANDLGNGKLLYIFVPITISFSN